MLAVPDGTPSCNRHTQIERTTIVPLASQPIITPVTALIDWNSQVHAAAPSSEGGPYELCSKTLAHVGQIIGRVLNDLEPARRYDVTLRLYHGWYTGFQPTDRRKAMVNLFASADFPALSARPNVIIRPDLQFGDQLTSARSSRFHAHLACHLPNTRRRDANDKTKYEEKMIDTSIAGEVVDLAHREPDRWLIVVGEDDDLVPPVFIAEGIRGTTGGRVLLVRKRPETQFLKLDELSIRP